jgi:hypothetical protein
MNKKTFPLTLMGLLCVVAGQTATAGYILDGKEWEVRGTLASWTNHQTTQVPADTDWTWATKDDWDASGLEATALTDPDWSALMGALDGDSVQASAYLATTFSQNTEL